MSILLKHNIKLLVCDMAGTVINENGIIYKSIGTTLKKMGYYVSPEDEKSWHGREKRAVLFDHIYKQCGDIPETKYMIPEVNKAEKLLIEELEKNYFKNNQIKLIDENLLNFFDKLRMDNVKIALNTGYPKSLQNKIITNLNLEDRIDGFISSEEVEYGRPAPYMIHRLMERFEISSVDNVAKIGDTANDMLEGKNAGCKLTIGVLSGADKKEDLLEHSNLVINKITDLDKKDLPVFLL